MAQKKRIITEKTVIKTARLAGLRFDEADCLQMQKELESILEHFARLDKIPTEGVTPAYHPFSQENHLRDDDPQMTDRQQEWLKIAGRQKDGYLIAPRTLEE